MNNSGKLIGINLLILLIYSALFLGGFWTDKGQYAGMGFGIFMMMAIAIHALVLLIIGIVLLVRKQRERGLAFIISMFVVLLVGFSACFGGMSIYDTR